MNMIRKRAGIPGYGETVNLPKPTTTEEVMELIRKEKRIELSFENCRYFDVRRWGLVNEYFNKAIHGMNVNYDGNEFFKRTEIVKRILTVSTSSPYHRAKLILIKTWFRIQDSKY